MSENKVKFCGHFCPYDKEKIICPLGYENVEKKDAQREVESAITATE